MVRPVFSSDHRSPDRATFWFDRRFLDFWKLGLASIPREQFHRSVLVANVTKMSLTCYEEIGRSDEDATRMLRYEETARVKFNLFGSARPMSSLLKAQNVICFFEKQLNPVNQQTLPEKRSIEDMRLRMVPGLCCPW